MVTVESLREVGLFGDLSEEILTEIAGMASFKAYEDGELVYQLGDDARDLYLVDSGRIRFSMGIGNRPKASGSIMVPGNLFGWAALLEEQPRRVATASCLEASTLYVIPSDKLLELFANNKAAGYSVMRRLATMIAHDFMSVLSV